jgi:methionine-S-sulfoxide reductase
MSKPTTNTSTIYLGGGCFWSKEYYLSRLNGVIATRVGFMGGQTTHPTYQQVCTKKTGHAEVVEVVYNTDLLKPKEILRYFFTIHDPTVDRRAKGGQYRSAIYFTSLIQELSARQWQKHLGSAGYPIRTEIMAAGKFWPADERHQQYCDARQLTPRPGKGLLEKMGGLSTEEDK